ncbi:MAG: hypothetical protein BBJ57_01295 [Desulfobacterales bacterium PC51MH44]|nr:hypothetical protein [Deltaproteobacteria bacterium]OEU66514.1 MAG: hypothetical protein BBJ57_01295 [Desulfobacterales bacterium PC51MH44]
MNSNADKFKGPKKCKGLFILFEGISDTVIDSQVILHARTIREREIADFEIWSFACLDELYKRSVAKINEAQELSGCKVRIFRGVRPSYPFSSVRNAYIFWKKLRKYRPKFEFIHARTDYSTTVCAYLKLLRHFELIWDCRGDSEAEFLGRYNHNLPLGVLLKWYQIINFRWRTAVASRACQKAIFVSKPLKELKARPFFKKKYAIIPSAASEKMFYFDKKLRKKMRQRLEYDECDKVIIYCGSMASYQCFPETVHLFDLLYQKDEKYKFLIITPQKDSAMNYLQCLPDGSWKIFSAKIIEVNSYLNAADYAVMLRNHNPINVVASPTKFAEYCLTGLPIIMTNSIQDSYNLAKRLGNLCAFGFDDKDNFVLQSVEDRMSIANTYQKILSKTSVAAAYSDIYQSC